MVWNFEEENTLQRAMWWRLLSFVNLAGWLHEDAIPWKQFWCSLCNRSNLPRTWCGMRNSKQLLLCCSLPCIIWFIIWSEQQYGCYKEIYRVLKPGQCFAAYEWCMTDAFDPDNAEHQKIKVSVFLASINIIYLCFYYQHEYEQRLYFSGRDRDWRWSAWH